MEPWLIAKLDALPQKPGVYLMKDKSGEIVYVGKAVNLKSRVRSYFNNHSDSRAFVRLLEKLLGDVETLVVSTEKEALLLENELIKKHRPKFNVRLRDDKNFICLRLDKRQTYPRLEIVRRTQKDGAVYFGPYASASSIRETLKIINRYFQLRTCTDYVLNNRKRPCLLYQLQRCPAPCVFDIPKESYLRHVEEVELFLSGKGDALIDALKIQMKVASNEMKFEEAARLRDQLRAIDRSLERQKIALSDRLDQDVVGFFREADRLVFYLLNVRQGRIAGGQPFFLANQEFPEAELLESFLNLYYAEGHTVPEEVLLPIELSDLHGLIELLTERRGKTVRIFAPQRGEKRDLVKMATANALESFRERRRSREDTAEILRRLKDSLHLSRTPARIECFDISHFQGSGLVASGVAATDGELDRSRYRHYKLKTVEGNDDFASMHEILHRRLSRGLVENDLPDLIVIDGGKGQLAAAVAAMRDLSVEGVDMVALAKSRDLNDRAEPDKSSRSPERVFLIGRKDPIVLPQNAPELFLLVRLRDEAHRFAINFQKKQMRRRVTESALEEIEGVGAARRQALLTHFGSLKRVSLATVEELAAVGGIGQHVAEKVFHFLHPSNKDSGEGEGDAQ